MDRVRLSTAPTDEQAQVTAYANGTRPNNWTLNAYAICASP